MNSTTTTRQLVKTMILDRFVNLDEYQVPSVVDEITALIRADAQLYEAYVDECLRTMVHNEALSVVSSQRIRARQVAQAQAALAAPSSPATLRPLADRLGTTRALGLRWLAHAEHIGSSHIKLMAMTGRQLDLAITYRARQRAGHDLKIRFLSEIRASVADDQSVQNVYTAEQLEELYQRSRSKTRTPPPAAAASGATR